MLRKANLALKRHFGVSVTVSGLVGFILGAFFGGPIGDAGSASVNYVWGRVFPPAKDLRLDFNAARGCSQGKLAEIRKLFEDPTISLEQGAEMLIICDTQSLRTTKESAPQDLSVRFPGCLVWRDALVLVRKSEAICAWDNVFICDGAKGRERATGAVGEPIDPIAPCSDDTLRRFGFSF